MRPRIERSADIEWFHFAVNFAGVVLVIALYVAINRPLERWRDKEGAEGANRALPGAVKGAIGWILLTVFAVLFFLVVTGAMPETATNYFFVVPVFGAIMGAILICESFSERLLLFLTWRRTGQPRDSVLLWLASLIAPAAAAMMAVVAVYHPCDSVLLAWAAGLLVFALAVIGATAWQGDRRRARWRAQQAAGSFRDPAASHVRAPATDPIAAAAAGPAHMPTSSTVGVAPVPGDETADGGPRIQMPGVTLATDMPVDRALRYASWRAAGWAMVLAAIIEAAYFTTYAPSDNAALQLTGFALLVVGAAICLGAAVARLLLGRRLARAGLDRDPFGLRVVAALSPWAAIVALILLATITEQVVVFAVGAIVVVAETMALLRWPAAAGFTRRQRALTGRASPAATQGRRSGLSTIDGLAEVVKTPYESAGP